MPIGNRPPRTHIKKVLLLLSHRSGEAIKANDADDLAICETASTQLLCETDGLVGTAQESWTTEQSDVWAKIVEIGSELLNDCSTGTLNTLTDDLETLLGAI